MRCDERHGLVDGAEWDSPQRIWFCLGEEKGARGAASYGVGCTPTSEARREGGSCVRERYQEACPPRRQEARRSGNGCLVSSHDLVVFDLLPPIAAPSSLVKCATPSSSPFDQQSTESESMH